MDGKFWPNVTLEVQGRGNGWNRIDKFYRGGSEATLGPNQQLLVYVNLLPFQLRIDAFEKGRLLLEAGQTAEFDSKDLRPTREAFNPSRK